MEVNVAAHVRAAHPLGQPLQRVEAAHLTCFKVAERREQARVLVRVLFRFRLIPAEQATEALFNRLPASVAASIIAGRGDERGGQTVFVAADRVLVNRRITSVDSRRAHRFNRCTASLNAHYGISTGCFSADANHLFQNCPLPNKQGSPRNRLREPHTSIDTTADASRTTRARHHENSNTKTRHIWA